MADEKITAMPIAGQLTGTEYGTIVQSGVNKKTPQGMHVGPAIVVTGAAPGGSNPRNAVIIGAHQPVIGNGSVAIGFNAGYGQHAGPLYNTMIGYSAGYAITTGDDNVIIGRNGAPGLTTGSANVLIGGNTNDLPTPNGSGQTWINGNVIASGIIAKVGAVFYGDPTGHVTVTAPNAAGLLLGGSVNVHAGNTALKATNPGSIRLDAGANQQPGNNPAGYTAMYSGTNYGSGTNYSNAAQCFLQGGHYNDRGGRVFLEAGATNIGVGGDISIISGYSYAPGVGRAGNILVRGADSAGGPGGNIIITQGAGTTAGHVIITSLPTADPTVSGAIWNNKGFLAQSDGAGTKPLQNLASFTVATLPGGTVGELAMVTDATLTMITGLGLAPVGGGGNTVPVFRDNAGWKII